MESVSQLTIIVPYDALGNSRRKTVDGYGYRFSHGSKIWPPDTDGVDMVCGS